MRPAVSKVRIHILLKKRLSVYNPMPYRQMLYPHPDALKNPYVCLPLLNALVLPKTR